MLFERSAEIFLSAREIFLYFSEGFKFFIHTPLHSTSKMTSLSIEDSASEKNLPDTRVQVVARFRPVSTQEEDAYPASSGDPNCCDISVDGRNVLIDDAGRRTTFPFTFDHVLDAATNQNGCYRHIAASLVDTVLSGINACVTAYGQTGSGKTHTMFGPSFDDASFHSKSKGGSSSSTQWQCPPSEYGIIPRLFDDIFARTRMQQHRVQCHLEVAFVQIYNEQVMDLITTLTLRVRQNVAAGGFESNALFSPIDSTDDLLALVREGLRNRVTAATRSNAQSSRSHAILTARIIQRDLDSGEMKVAVLHLVDLAGSEKVSKTGASGERLVEASKINQSLFCLSKVIAKLSVLDRKIKRSTKSGELKDFIPYRDSMLTKLLKNTLGGNSKTVLLLCCSPHAYNVAETVATLEFGSRARSIRNRPIQNIELTAHDLRSAIQKSMDVISGQTIRLARARRDVEIHRKLVQQVLSKIPSSSSVLNDIFQALPMLHKLPKVFKWGVRYVPIFVLRNVFGFAGISGMLKGMVVCKEWQRMLTLNRAKDWENNCMKGMWKEALHREVRREDDTAALEDLVVKRTVDDTEKGQTLSWRLIAVDWIVETEKKRRAQARAKFSESNKSNFGCGGLRLLS